MYPTLHHALLDLTGIDLPFLKFMNSFGFFVALAFVFASWTLGLELRRKEREGLLKPMMRTVKVGYPASPMELISNALLGFVLGWKGLYVVLNFASATADPQGTLLSGKGNFIGGIVVAAIMAGLKWRSSNKHKLAEPRTEQMQMLAHEHSGNITLIAALWGVIGAKLFHWLENPDEFIRFIKAPAGAELFSGLTMYGGLIFAGFMVIRYFRQNGIPPWAGADAAAPGVMLAYGIGRLGCQTSGDGDWGIVNNTPAPSWIPDWLWSYTYPNNVNGVGVPMTEGTIFPGYGTVLPEPVWPTPLYEVIMCVGLFFVLWAFRKKLKVPGMIFFMFLALNGVERFLIEKIRVNVQFAGTWTQAEVISLILILVGIVGMILRQRTKTLSNGPEEAH